MNQRNRPIPRRARIPTAMCLILLAFAVTQAAQWEPYETGDATAEWVNGIGEPGFDLRRAGLLLEESDGEAGLRIWTVEPLAASFIRRITFDIKDASECDDELWLELSSDDESVCTFACSEGTQEQRASGWFRITFDGQSDGFTQYADCEGLSGNFLEAKLAWAGIGTRTLDTIRIYTGRRRAFVIDKPKKNLGVPNHW